MEPDTDIGRPAIHRLRRQFAGLTAHTVDGAAILAEFLDPPADPRSIRSRLAAASRAGAKDARALRANTASEDMDLPRRADLYRLAYLLEFTVEHMEVTGDFAAGHDIIALPDELLIAVEAIQDCTRAAHRFVGTTLGDRRARDRIAVSAPAEFAASTSTGPFHSTAGRSGFDLTIEEVGEGIGHIARCLGQVAKLLPVVDTLA
ncbi:hypothetical protein [Nocardia sp. NPDC024068]|uniref:hypothetical protein n=1 Tax=Nocardia sp. NPDC024068 TaxID=3157197 RepID=UPI003411F0AF